MQSQLLEWKVSCNNRNIFPVKYVTLELGLGLGLGALSAEKTLLLLCPFIWRRGTQRQQTDTHLLHGISVRDPFSWHRLLSASFVVVELQLRLVSSKLSMPWQHLIKDLHRRQSEWLMSVTGNSSILCALSKNIWGDFISPSLVPVSVCSSHSGYVSGEKQASPETDHPKALGWISPHNCYFLPLTKDDELKFQPKIPGIWVAALRDVRFLHSPHLWSDVTLKSASEELEIINLNYSMITQMLGHCKQRGNLWWKCGHDSTAGVWTGPSWTGSFAQGLIVSQCVFEGEVLIKKIFKHLCNCRHIIQVCNTSLHQVQLVPASKTGSGHKWHNRCCALWDTTMMEMQLSVLCLICQQSTSLLPAACGLSGTPAISHQAWGKIRKTKSCNCAWFNILFWGDDIRT